VDVYLADETLLLPELVDRQRDEIAGLLDDLTDEEARASLVPSLTTVLGLVAHATFVEKVWFHHRVGGRPRDEVGIPETVDESFVLAADDTVDSVRAAYLAACEHSRSLAAGRDLDETFDWRGTPVSLRYLYGHLVQELARHAGHGDILREQLLARRPGA
jgi:hypothetical protein